LKIGERLRIDNRHLVPETLEQGILINIPQRMLFLFQGGRLMMSYPAGLGRPDRQTPTGEYHITRLEKNKTWCVPKSIQEEMRRAGKPVLKHVAPGPGNPLGKYWIGLSVPGYGIHGTIAPASIYRMRTHGCIRLHPDDAAALYAQAFPGMPVKIIYAPVLLARLGDGRILAEVNPDVYNRAGDPLPALRDLAHGQGVAEKIDWTAAGELARARQGVAREIGRTAPSREKISDRKVLTRFESTSTRPHQVQRIARPDGLGAADRAGALDESPGRKDSVVLQYPHGRELQSGLLGRRAVSPGCARENQLCAA
jgi:L,D-transpeptidase ErfK/SrfK